MGLDETLLNEVRDRFALVDTCPDQGERVFFENAGGALTLKSVLETSDYYAAIPDNQGRDNVCSRNLVDTIKQAKQDLRVFMNASSGQFFVGESGTELLFRLVMNACLGVESSGQVLGSTLEHPASRSATFRWAKIGGHDLLHIPHDNATGTITAEAYAKAVTPETRVATIVHTSPVTGIGVDVAACASAIRKISPDCFIIVDGIQHAAHGDIDVDHYNIDGYVISPYKVFSRHGYGVAWISDRMTTLPHDGIVGGAKNSWELGTRDTGSYATISDVISYFEWLGSKVTKCEKKRERIEAAGVAIKAQERALTDAMIYGVGNLPGLAELDGVSIIGGVDNPSREGLVSFTAEKVSASEIVETLNAAGIRTHIRKADHYSGNILEPLGLEACVRVSLCHYNSPQEVSKFLAAMKEILV